MVINSPKHAMEPFQVALEAAPTGMLMMDGTGKIVLVNAQIEKLFGYARDELLGRRIEILVPERFRPRHPELRKTFFADPKTRVMGAGRELFGLRKDGSEMPIEIALNPLQTAEGDFVLSSIADITQRQRTQEALRASEQHYRFMSETMPQIIWTSQPDGNIDFYNQRWYDYTGLTIEQSRDWGSERVLHPDDLRSCIDRWTQSHTTGAEFTVECRFKRAGDGTYRWHLCRGSPFRNGNGRIIHWVGTCTDIDDQKRGQQGLREAYANLEQRVSERTEELKAAKTEADRANKAKSEFLANMSHEIRTPLNAVIGLGYLLEQTSLTVDQRQYVSEIQFAGRSLLSVVNNVLDLSKIEAGEVSLEEESFELPKLLLDISQMLAAQATAKGIELIIQPVPDLPRQVVGDVSRLRQVLINLLNNAIKFTDVGHVELKAYCTRQGSGCVRLRCEVIDTGIGIEPAAIKRMFAPFTQADASTTRRFGGTGLGLSIARHLLELMGGEIDVTSAVAVGSTFWFEIPLRIAHGADTTISDRGLRIAIVDSGIDAVGGLSGVVHALGWSTQTFPTGEKLLEYLNATQPNAWPHVLIVQLQLSDMDAHQLIKRLQKQCTHSDVPPIIVVTDSPQSYLTHKPLMRATDALLVLPLTSSAMFNAVSSAVSDRPDGREHMLQSTTDVLHAQWLIGVRVLVVDDSAVNREVAQGILRSQGAIVSTCSDGRAAVEYVRAHHRELDVVLMDVQMSIMDGNEATELIRGELNLRVLPIVALTAGALVSERQRALKAGMNDIVTKPFDPQVLIRKVRYLVEQTRNEPIPIAVLDRRRGLQPAVEPLIPSIDADVVQRMFGQDLTLFTSALSRMLRDYVDFAEPISAPLGDQVVRSQLTARVHELRGSAGLMGAMGVMHLAGTAETALEQGRSIDVVGPILGRLTSAYSDMRDEAQFWLARQAEREALSDVKTAPRPTIEAADVEELYALLDSRNLAALDKFSLLSPSLSEFLGAARFDRLRDAVDNLDFPLGAQLLRASGSLIPA
jgi:PAS domain S-box-containing protein